MSSENDPVPLHFIGEEVQVSFDRQPALLKVPHAPSGFRWHGRYHRVEAVLSSWFDYGRRSAKSKKSGPEQQVSAARMGSWGVGRFYFRVRDQDGRVFDLYYDRSPKDASDRLGHWFLWRELEAD